MSSEFGVQSSESEEIVRSLKRQFGVRRQDSELRTLNSLPLPAMNERPLIMFDGVCNFCNYWVNFAMKRDRKGKLRFTALQGETAKTVLPKYKVNPDAITSVILIENGKAYTQSSAVFRICRHLDGAWKMAYVFIFIPKFLRDLVYNWIAKNRYRWFGKREVCRIPTPQERERFLD